jgi:hypothetical protein
MGRARRCDSRCRDAKGTRCLCWCGGAFHGKKGLANRQAVLDGAAGVLEEHGFVKGETAFILQGRMDIDAAMHPVATPVLPKTHAQKIEAVGPSSPKRTVDASLEGTPQKTAINRPASRAGRKRKTKEAIRS